MKQKMMVLFTIFVLLSLTFTIAGSAQAQGPDPLQKRMPVDRELPETFSSGQEVIDILPVVGENLVEDPSFENAFPHGFPWHTGSTNFGTAFCTLGACGNGGGTARPRTGNVWAWFGGTPAEEHAYVSQLVPVPECGATLKFYFWIGAAANGSDANDKFIVRVGNTQVFTANATQKNSYPSYTLISINLNFMADGDTRDIVFESHTTGQVVTFNLDDISMTSGPCVTISGNAGDYGVAVSYTNVVYRYASTDLDGNYSFKVPLHWSGKVAPLGAFTPASRTYTNLTTDQTGQNYIPIRQMSGYASVSGALLSYMDGTLKTVTSQSDGKYTLNVPSGWTGTVTPSHPCFTFNPVNRSYTNYQGNGISENFTATFSGSAGCADITVSIDGANRGWFGLLPGASTRVSYSPVDSGPVKIVSNNNIPVIGAERLIYAVNDVNTSFSEIMGLPDSELDNVYWLPWYNNVNLDTQLRFANPNALNATVHVYIGGAEVIGSPFTVGAGLSTRKSFAGIDAGPVKIESTQNIVASERVIYKVNNVHTSFSEMMALPEKQLDNVYWLPWYNNVNLDSQLRFANVTANPATVTITIGGVAQAPINLAAGESTRISYTGVDAGPVKIESTQPIVASERVIYKVNNIYTSFSEVMALPNSKLSSTYWLPWYNNLTLDTQLRIANVSNNQATITVTIGGTTMPTINLGAGESVRVSYPNLDSGPVRIQSTQTIVAAERVIYKVNNVNTSFSEMMALPNSLLSTTYWFPWYNNIGLDTQLRFGVP